MINTGRRELDELNAELARLTAKKNDLEAAQARRQEQLEAVVKQMEEMEAAYVFKLVNIFRRFWEMESWVTGVNSLFIDFVTL